MFVAKSFEQQASGFVVSHHSHGKNVNPQVGKIIDRIGAASRHDGSLAMLQNQDRSFPRHPRDFSKDEFVGHQVANHGDRDLGE